MSAASANHKTPIYKVLYFQVICAIVIGILLGFLAPEIGAQMKPFGDGFIRLIKMIIAPVIFCTVVTGIAGMEDMKKVGKTGGLALLYFEVVSTIALIIGLIIVNTVQPGVGMHVDPNTLDQAAVSAYTGPGKMQTTTEFLMNVIPNTVVGAFANGDILQVLFFSILFGFALHKFGGRGTLIFDVIEKSAHVLFQIVGMIMRVAPVGAFGAMAFTIGKYGIASLLPLAKLMGTFYLTCLLFIFGVLGTICRIHGFSIMRYISYIKEELLIVLGTSSSESVLPRMMTKMELAGVSRSVVGLVIPTGYSFNLDGTAIYLTMAAVFIAQACDVSMTLTQYHGAPVFAPHLEGRRRRDGFGLHRACRHALRRRPCACRRSCTHSRHRPLHVRGPRPHQHDRQRHRLRRGRPLVQGGRQRQAQGCDAQQEEVSRERGRVLKGRFLNTGNEKVAKGRAFCFKTLREPLFVTDLTSWPEA